MINDITPAGSKIHILFLVSRAPGVSYQMLMDRCMQSLYMDFFSFSQAYNELISGNLMDKTESDTGTDEVVGINETLTITKGGSAILEDVIPSLNPQVRSYLNRAADELAAQVRSLNSIRAIVTDGSTAVLTDTSAGSGISGKITITVECASAEEAETLCRSWRTGGYRSISDLLASMSHKEDRQDDEV